MKILPELARVIQQSEGNIFRIAQNKQSIFDLLPTNVMQKNVIYNISFDFCISYDFETSVFVLECDILTKFCGDVNYSNVRSFVAIGHGQYRKILPGSRPIRTLHFPYCPHKWVIMGNIAQ